MKYVTQSTIPSTEAFLSDRFVLLNMYPDPDGIWLVDKEHPQWEQIKQTAIDVAKTFGDAETLKKLQQ